MIAVIFEVLPTEAGREHYLELATQLRESLLQMPGFISIERFQSLSDPGKLLSLSFWEDEAAVARWRALGEHRAAQSAGRSGLFADYRIRVGHVVRDYSLDDRAQSPADSRAAHP